MAEQKVWTFQDLVDHVIDVVAARQADDRTYRRARSACLAAYRDLQNAHDWRYQARRINLQTVASYGTGTIVYDHTGGTNELEVTLSDGIWPSWADFGRIIIDGVTYSVDSRKSDTVVTLKSSSNPGADVAAGTSFTIYRGVYPLPVNFRRLHRLYDIEQDREIPIIDPDQHHRMNVSYYQTPGVPQYATIVNDGEYLGALSLSFLPPPSTIRQYEMRCELEPRAMDIYKYATGTVTTDASTTVEGSGTAFTSAMEGSVLRLSSSVTVEPTSVVGNLAAADNLFAAQRIIMEVTDANTIVVDSAIATLSGVKFTISDPVDIHENSMFTALLRWAEWEFAAQTNRDPKDVDMREQRKNRALTMAMEADNRSPYAAGTLSLDPFRRSTVSTED